LPDFLDKNIILQYFQMIIAHHCQESLTECCNFSGSLVATPPRTPSAPMEDFADDRMADNPNAILDPKS
jgi:hypothetical protein